MLIIPDLGHDLGHGLRLLLWFLLRLLLLLFMFLLLLRRASSSALSSASGSEVGLPPPASEPDSGPVCAEGPVADGAPRLNRANVRHQFRHLVLAAGAPIVDGSLG